MHVARIKSRHTDRQGREREYESRLLRRTYRDGGKVRNETLANLSKMPDRMVDAVEAALKGEALVPAGEAAVTVARSLPHGHVAAVHAMAAARPAGAARPGRPAARPGPGADHLPGRARPGSKLSTLAWWGDTTLGPDLGIERRHHRRGLRGDGLAAGPPGRDRGASSPAGTWPRPRTRPRMALFDLSTSWLEGTHCPLGGARLLPRRQEGQGPDRVRAAHRPRGPPGRGPGASRATPPTRPRSPRSPASCTTRSGSSEMVMVGDRGMITTARIEALRELDGQYGVDHRAARPRHQQALADDGPLQLSPVRRAGPRRDQPPPTSPASG